MSAILFRCDANEQIGFGHLSRCVAWAEAFVREGATVGFSGNFSEDAKRFLDANGFEALSGGPPRAVFFDGYHFDDKETQDWKGSARIWVDDFGNRRHYDCEGIVNFTVGASRLAYPETRRFLGPGYFPARSSLRPLRSVHLSGAVRHVLVMIGGFDRGNYTTRMAKTLLELDDALSVTVALGSRFSAREEFENAMAPWKERVAVREFTADSAELYRGADACVCGGGLTKYECAYLGLPAAVVSQTPQQHGETQEFSCEGLAWNIGLGTELAENQLRRLLEEFLKDGFSRERMSRRGQEIFPEDPAGNLAREILSL